MTRLYVVARFPESLTMEAEIIGLLDASQKRLVKYRDVAERIAEIRLTRVFRSRKSIKYCQ